ncbi:SurA N-terminal domain-containing protein [Bradyrhizobium oligotrophicum]|uniref:SurA N-terminal domain-containing protein n=1 Tax=Bradyrhizobium oligotrophicum TaxID=44255 RepID=UPI003EB9FEDB
MTIAFPPRLRALIICTLAVLVWGTGMMSARAQSIVVMVNGDPITDYDVEQRTKLNFLSTRKQQSRQEIINELIDDKVKIKEGKKFGVEPTSADVDQSYAGMGSRMRLNAEQLTRSLESQGVRPETLKARIKAEIVWTSLVRGRYKERLIVSDRDVAAAVAAAGGDGDQQGQAFEYKMQPIVLIVANASNQGAMEIRQKEAEALRARIQSCADANTIFKTTANAVIKEIVVKTSADIPPNLRKLLDDTPIGHLTPPEATKQGIQMVALCARTPTTIDTPKKREIKEQMYTKKYEATSKAYLQEVRKAAMIEYRR